MTIAILSNDHAWTYNLRKEVIQALISEGHRIVLILSYGEKIEKLKEMGCEFIDIPFERHGTDFLKELKLISNYKKILKELKPDIVLSYTIKPNIYGGMVCNSLKIPFFPNITGLGTAVENKGPLQPLFIMLYKLGLKKATNIFFQNTENLEFMKKHRILNSPYTLLPGSGVNLSHFKLLEYPDENKTSFVFISRIMKEKGIDQYLEAAKYIKGKYENTDFHICGFCEAEYKGKLNEYIDNGTVIYHGMVSDVRDVLKDVHCTVHPTYYPEGLSNVLLESATSGRALITTDRAGCREVIEDSINGYICKEKDSSNLILQIEKFLNLSYEEKKQMGLNGRLKVEKEFDRNIVVSKYLEQIKKVEKK